MSGVSGRVLVVDDNKVIRQLIRVNLELEGFEVVTAADGAECLDVVHRVCPDVVTLDVVMPRLDGIKTAERLRADPRTSHLPVAIISACGEHEVAGGPVSGVDAFLAKPFEPSELVRVVRQLMHRERRERREANGQDGGEEPAAADARRQDSVGVPDGVNVRQDPGGGREATHVRQDPGGGREATHGRQDSCGGREGARARQDSGGRQDAAGLMDKFGR
ncbi:response regulator [Streptomyces sp. LMG1-1-1.1]|uniref:response regulator n=1 Tax=Streptomyces sp. LMG1-1-1.1 TaxID=3135245 RepID=UPI0039C946F4